MVRGHVDSVHYHARLNRFEYRPCVRNELYTVMYTVHKPHALDRNPATVGQHQGAGSQAVLRDLPGVDPGLVAPPAVHPLELLERLAGLVSEELARLGVAFAGGHELLA